MQSTTRLDSRGRLTPVLTLKGTLQMNRITVQWDRNKSEQCNFLYRTRKYFVNWNLKFYNDVMMLFFFPEMGSPYVAPAGFELVIPLPQTDTCWDCRHVPTFQTALMGF